MAEGVSTAGAVIALAQKYNVKMPVLTAVARIVDNELTPRKAVLELMNLPQVILILHEVHITKGGKLYKRKFCALFFCHKVLLVYITIIFLNVG